MRGIWKGSLTWKTHRKLPLVGHPHPYRACNIFQLIVLVLSTQLNCFVQSHHFNHSHSEWMLMLLKVSWMCEQTTVCMFTAATLWGDVSVLCLQLVHCPQVAKKSAITTLNQAADWLERLLDWELILSTAACCKVRLYRHYTEIQQSKMAVFSRIYLWIQYIQIQLY